MYKLLLLNMPKMAHDWINKSILFYSVSWSTAQFPVILSGSLFFFLLDFELGLEKG